MDGMEMDDDDHESNHHILADVEGEDDSLVIDLTNHGLKELSIQVSISNL